MPEIGRTILPYLYITGSGIIQRLNAANATDIFIQSRVSGDSVNRFQIDGGGSIYWGTGSAAVDIKLYRGGANVLMCDDTFRVGAAVIAAYGLASGNAAFRTNVTGDTQYRLSIDNTGLLEWGSGSAALDTNLYRSASNSLRTGDNLLAAGAVVGGDGAASGTDAFRASVSGDSQYRVIINNDGSIEFGGGSGATDILLQRRAADILNTPDRIEMGTLGIGNWAAATGLGALNGVYELFDDAGNSKGYVATYATYS